MFGAGQPLDVSKYYLILPDSIGLGASSKPSDEINPPKLGFIAHAKEAVPNGEFVLIPASDQTAGHQTLARAGVYGKYVADFLAKTTRSANSQ